jgi:hypothetical protein
MAGEGEGAVEEVREALGALGADAEPTTPAGAGRDIGSAPAASPAPALRAARTESEGLETPAASGGAGSRADDSGERGAGTGGGSASGGGGGGGHAAGGGKGGGGGGAAGVRAGAGGGKGSEVDMSVLTAVYGAPPVSVSGYVSAYGWMTKQGEGGLFRLKNWKRRFFALYHVPQGAVLVYYDDMGTETERILGYVDLRDATDVRVAKAQIDGADAEVVEVVTPSRTFLLRPESLCEEVVANEDSPTLFILGWPVKPPRLVAAQLSLVSALQRWQRLLQLTLQGLRLTKQFRTQIVADSTAVLPDHVILRVAPTDFSMLDAADPDRCLASWPYKDLRKWTPNSPRELQLAVRSATGTVRFTFQVDSSERLKEAIDHAIDQALRVRSLLRTKSGPVDHADTDDI